MSGISLLSTKLLSQLKRTKIPTVIVVQKCQKCGDGYSPFSTIYCRRDDGYHERCLENGLLEAVNPPLKEYYYRSEEDTEDPVKVVVSAIESRRNVCGTGMFDKDLMAAHSGDQIRSLHLLDLQLTSVTV